MYYYDPDYVKEMSRDGYDPHLDLACFAGALTRTQLEEYVVLNSKEVEDLDPVEAACLKVFKGVRKNFKQANYSCIYGVGAPKLARTLKIKVKEAQALIEAYWGRNWAIKKFAEEQIVKYVGREMWVQNPVSKFWHSLRAEKDIFSTINQSTGVFCFDSWIKAFFQMRKQLSAQFHDEVVLEIKKGNRERCEKMLKDAIASVNDKLKLNIKLDVDVQFGDTYADIH